MKCNFLKNKVFLMAIVSLCFGLVWFKIGRLGVEKRQDRMSPTESFQFPAGVTELAFQQSTTGSTSDKFEAHRWSRVEKDETWIVHRSYPQLNVPDEGYYRAFLESQQEGDPSVDALAPDVWESMGPFNLAGRMLALAVDHDDPGIVWAGSATGGLWRLTISDGDRFGYRWDRIDTGYPVLGVRTIAIDPRDSDILYIGTGEAHFHRDHFARLLRTMYTYGIGILKTTDGGATWTRSLDWSYNQSRGVLSIEINPTNPDVVFAGTTEGTYRSTDAGQTWQCVHRVLQAVDVIINPHDPDIVFVSCGNAGSPGTGIYRSMDGGDTWERLTNGLPDTWTGKVPMDIYQAEPNILYADIMNLFELVGLYKSEDNGDSWALVSDIPMGAGTGLYCHYVRVNPVDNKKIFRTEIYYGYSEDGGETWTLIDDSESWYTDSTQMHVDHHAFANHPTDPNTFYAANDGGVYRTRDGGKTFQDLNRGLVTTQFYPKFASSRTDPDLALGGLQDNGSIIYRGSPQWETWILGGDGMSAAVHPSDNDIMYASFYWLSIFKSTNRGKDFRYIGPVNFFLTYYGEDPYGNPNSRIPHDDEVCKMGPYVILPGDIMYGATNYVYKSMDAGETWAVCNLNRPLSSQPIMSLSASELNPDVVYIASRPDPVRNTRPGVFATFNGGRDWEDIKGILPNRDIIVYVSPYQANVVYATLGGFGTSHLYRSENGGRNWTDIGSGLPDVPTNAVIVDPQHYRNIYVGNDLGVWVSKDDGRTWHRFREGMPTASIVMDFSIVDCNRRIRAVTHGNGIYERSLLPAEEGVLAQLPASVVLHQNYPNPFNSETRIPFALPQSAEVSLSIYNTMGQVVKTFGPRSYTRGQQYLIWDGTGHVGRQVASGIYTYVLQMGEHVEEKRMTLVR